MKRNKLFAGALALAMTAVTVFSPVNVSNIKAAEVTDKPNFDWEITGNHTKKKISQADADVINKAFGYDNGFNTINICSADTTGYINWDNSAIASWQVYQTEVFQPVLLKDGNGNLSVATDENGEVQKAWDMYATYQTETADEISHNGGFSSTFDKTEEEINQRYYGGSAPSYVTDAYAGDGGLYNDWVLSENHFCLSNTCNKGITTINSHLGITELTAWKPLSSEEQMETQKLYVSSQMQITDAYLIRFYYTADEIPMNWTNRNWQRTRVSAAIWIENLQDVYGNSYGAIDLMSEFDAVPITTEDRNFRYADFWILPEGVQTVLTLEDTNVDETPDDTVTPSESYVVDFSKTDSQNVSKEDFAALLKANKESDVVIKSNNGVTFTFAKGTMTEVDGKKTYDFSTSINNTYADSMPSYITKNSFVSQINFNYSGKLPAAASIRFYVGTEYAGKTLYYSLMNKDNTFAVVNSYVVDAEGYITVKQDYCSSYVLTTEEPKLAAQNISIKKANVKLSKTSYTYDGKEKKPSVSVTLNGKTLVKNKDYTVSYKSNKNIGTAIVTITGKGNYTGTVSQKFKIQLANGKTFTSGKYKYKVTGTSTVAFNGIKSTSTTKVTIPNTIKYGGKTFKVTSISEGALKKNTKVTSVTIGANVTKIGANAFWGCKKLSTVTMGKTVMTIGTSAFEGCTKLSKVTMGSTVTTIGTKAFKNCTALKNITIPSKVTKINKQAFYGCKNLKTITMKSTKLKTVGKEIFKGINSKATIKVTKSKLSAYKKLLKGKGQGRKVKIVKY